MLCGKRKGDFVGRLVFRLFAVSIGDGELFAVEIGFRGF
jgi:hypothetical protein